MGTPFMAEIRIFGGTLVPKGWAQCNGQFLPINQNQALFALLGTTYGGNGQTTFALPDLRGRTPIHFGAGFIQGQVGGQEFHTITMSEMPAHTHVAAVGKTVGTQPVGAGAYLADNVNLTYAAATNLTALSPATITNIGGSQPHENRQPFLALNFCIALIGIFPSHN